MEIKGERSSNQPVSQLIRLLVSAYHDLAGGSSGILHGHRVVEDQRPQQPDGLPDGELRSTRL